MEPGEFAVRGGILDLFPPGRSIAGAARLLRRHAGIDQAVRPCRRSARRASIQKLDPDADHRRSRSARRRQASSGSAMSSCSAGRPGDDPLYEAVSAGQRYPGMEHWLPLFHERLETLLRLCARCAVSASIIAPTRPCRQRFEQIEEHYEARVEALGGGHVRCAALQAGAAADDVPGRRGVGRGACRSARSAGSRRSTSMPATRWSPCTARPARSNFAPERQAG